MIDIYLTAYGGATVWFADNLALQGSLVNTLKVEEDLLELPDTTWNYLILPGPTCCCLYLPYSTWTYLIPYTT